MPSSLKISVIIPVYDEAETIVSCIANVKECCGDNSEIIIVDGSVDGSTLSAVDDAGVRLLASPPGRAAQMNYGAQKAVGDILIFLHADTILPHAADSLVRKALRAPCATAGAFKLGFDTPSRTMNFIAFSPTCVAGSSVFLTGIRLFSFPSPHLKSWAVFLKFR